VKISYDPDVDAIYIQLIAGDHECRTVRLSEDVALDFGPGEKLVGIEILDAKKVIGKGKLPRLVIDNLPVDGFAETGQRNGRGKARRRTAKTIRRRSGQAPKAA